MAKKLRYSRWRRLPGAYRIGEQKGPDLGSELQRLTLYLPWRVLDEAEAQARRAGAPSVQTYCEQLLRDLIETEHARHALAEAEARRGPFQGLDAIANDPDYLAELSASARPREGDFDGAVKEDMTFPEGDDAMTATVPPPDATEGAIQVVLRHAAMLGDEPSGLLSTLRRGEPMGTEPARGLLQALIVLEQAYRDARVIDRRLAYALHRLAFEGQVLLTDAFPDLPADPATVDALRLIQEAVDRVLSGEDIRYYAEAPSADPSA